MAAHPDADIQISGGGGDLGLCTEMVIWVKSILDTTPDFIPLKSGTGESDPPSS